MRQVTDVELYRPIYVLAFAIEVPDKPEFKPIFVGFEVVTAVTEDYYLPGCNTA
jgi:hypothetical protein